MRTYEQNRRGNGDKARRYRDRAKECRRRATETKGPDARAGFLQVAKSYERMADVIERKSGGDTP
jgi:hypothetical protein